MNRCSGILMPVFSLPSPYGIGTLGKAAYDFADFLHAAGQHCWQMLPLGPTSYGDSPYQSFSTYAGNPYFIDLELLIEDGLLTRDEVESQNWGTNPRYVDYGRIYESRFAVLQKAKDRGWERDQAEVAAFQAENCRWLPDYALYMACKRHFGMRSWTEWDDADIRLRRSPEVLEQYRTLLREDVELFTYLQFLFFRQWNRLRDYLHSLDIQVIGDLPIYVAMDSADVWAEPECFQLNDQGVPTEVSGVQPDYFSAAGQRWGNPLYAWDRMQADGFGWWIRRVDGASKLYDVIRIDHFRGVDAYWAVPYGETTAKNGHWVKGPGMSLVGVLTSWFPQLRFIAEDLGYPTPGVQQLLQDSGLPGMKVLEFAFDSRDTSSYLPHSYGENCVCYTGTHDNSPLALWKDEAAPEDIDCAREYLGLNDREDVCVLALVDTLEYLKRGGRISKTTALAGGLLNIKPVLTIEKGEILLIGKARGSRQGNNLLVEKIRACGGIDFQLPILLGYTGLTDAFLKKYVEDSRALWENGVDGLESTLIGGVIGTHAGPGAIAVAFFRRG